MITSHTYKVAALQQILTAYEIHLRIEHELEYEEYRVINLKLNNARVARNKAGRKQVSEAREKFVRVYKLPLWPIYSRKGRKDEVNRLSRLANPAYISETYNLPPFLGKHKDYKTVTDMLEALKYCDGEDVVSLVGKEILVVANAKNSIH